MEAFLNVTRKRSSFYEDRRTPPEIHLHDVLGGDMITLEGRVRRYQVHVTSITPETLVLEVQGLRPTGSSHDNPVPNLRRYVLPRNTSLSLSAPSPDEEATWTFEWSQRADNN